MQKTTRISATQVYSEIFWKFPKFLLNNEKYSDLTNDDRIAYMLIKDRLNYSLAQNNVDENGDVYIIFTRDQLKDELHVGKNKIAKIKQRLQDVGLLQIEKQGFNAKEKKNLPDRFYLCQPEYEHSDLISQASQVGALQPSGSPILGRRYQNEQSTDTKGNSSSENCNKVPSTLDKTGRPILGQYKDNNLDTIKDTIKDTDKWNFSTSKYSQELVEQQNNDLRKHMSTFLTQDKEAPMFLSKESINLLSMWFRTPQEISECISTILNAANDSRGEALEQVGKHELNFEDYQEELKGKVTNKLRRFFNKMRTSKKGQIKNPKNYLYISMRNLFDSWQNEIMMNNSEE